MRSHPLVCFRDGRAGLVGGPDLWEVIGGLVGGDVVLEARIARTAELSGPRRDQVEAALAYYAEFTSELDVQIAANDCAAQEAEALWRRQHDLLTG